ncbi:basic proline-rich protein-like [Vulpes lagopus]|uniref:basic proline-rich protein-like n=1 Tax=Vulpes lagopus TaxID=494514 RepID=UPI001BCA116C|nr:basic proline-rich protein-like [Vulpes lagopus]
MEREGGPRSGGLGAWPVGPGKSQATCGRDWSGVTQPPGPGQGAPGLWPRVPLLPGARAGSGGPLAASPLQPRLRPAREPGGLPPLLVRTEAGPLMSPCPDRGKGYGCGAGPPGVKGGSLSVRRFWEAVEGQVQAKLPPLPPPPLPPPPPAPPPPPHPRPVPPRPAPGQASELAPFPFLGHLLQRPTTALRATRTVKERLPESCLCVPMPTLAPELVINGPAWSACQKGQAPRDCQWPLLSRRDTGTSPPGQASPGSHRAAAQGIANAFRLMAVLHQQCQPALPPGPLPPPFAEEKRPSAGHPGSNMAAPVSGPLSL